MHVRFSTCRGMPVVEDGSDEALGAVDGIFVHPDTGAIEGFFVQIAGMFNRQKFFLSSLDILHWGLSVRINDAEALAPLEERVRLQSIFEAGRIVLGQTIVTESGRSLGRCTDVQFDTRNFRLEWMFPRKWWMWGEALPATDIIEVRGDAIIVRNPLLPASEKQERLLGQATELVG